MTFKEKYNSIDQTKLPENAKSYMAEFKKDSDNFTNKQAMALMMPVLDRFIKGLKDSGYGDAVKGGAKKETKKAETPKEMAKEIVEEAVEQPETKTGKPKVGKISKGDFMKIAKEIRKEGEPWNDAMKRAGEIIRTQKEVVKKEATRQYEKLKKFIEKHPEVYPMDIPVQGGGFRKTTVNRDAPRVALAKGKRVSKAGWKNQYGKSDGGKTYYEYRSNRYDTRRQRYPFLAEGGEVEGHKHVLHIDGQNWFLEKIDSTHFYMSNDRNHRGMAHHIGQHKGEPYYEEVREWLKTTYAKGGEITPKVNAEIVKRAEVIYANNNGSTKEDFDMAYTQAIRESGYNVEEFISTMKYIGAEYGSDIEDFMYAKGGSIYDGMSEKEFLNKYWGANVFFENPSEHFDIKKMSSSNDDKIDKFIEELKREGYSIKKKSYSDFTSVMGVRKKMAKGGELDMNKYAGAGMFAHGGIVKNIREDIKLINSRLKSLEETNTEEAYQRSEMLRKQKANLEALLLTYEDNPEYESRSIGATYYARGGYMSKGELVWNKLSSAKRHDFLHKHFHPEMTPRSIEILVNKSYNFLPKKIKIKMESVYANVEEYANGGEITPKVNAEIVKRAEVIYANNNGSTKEDFDMAYMQAIRESGYNVEEFISTMEHIGAEYGSDVEDFMYAKGGYTATGEDYEYINTFGIPQDDFNEIVEAWHKSNSLRETERVNSRLVFRRMENKYGEDKIEEISKYIYLTHEGHEHYAKGGETSKLSAGVYRVGRPKKISPVAYAQNIVEIFENGDISTATDYARKSADFHSLKQYPVISEEQLEAQYKFAKGGLTGKIDYSKQTTADFTLGEIVWDVENRTYGTIIGIYDDYPSSKYELRLDSDGMQPTENLRKVGSKGDKGTKEQLNEAITQYARLVKQHGKDNNYPKQIKPEDSKGVSISKSTTYIPNRNIETIHAKIKDKKVTLNGKDILDGVYAKNEALKTPFEKYAAYDEIANMADAGWDALNIESGSQIYNSDATQKKLADYYEKNGIDAKYLKYNAAQRKIIADVLTDENQHALRNYFALRGYIGESEYNYYKDLYDEAIKEKRKIFLNPANISYQPKKKFAEGGELSDIKIGDVLISSTGVKVKVVDYDSRFGGRIKADRMDEFATGKPSQWMPIKKFKKFAEGGKIGFKGLSNKVAKYYANKSVPSKYQSLYGKKYDKSEAKEVGDKVAAKVYRQQQSKKK